MKNTRPDLSNLAFFLVLLSGMVLSAGGHLAVGDEETMFRVTQNLAAGGGLAIGREELLIPAPRFTGFLPTRPASAPTTSAVPGREGQMVSKYGIGASLLALPLYLSGWVLDRIAGSPFPGENARLWTAMLNPLALAACGWLVVRFAQELGYRTSTGRLLALAALFSTFSWPYVKTFYSQGSMAFLVLACAYCAFRWRREARPVFLWALGLCCTGVILLRVSEAIILPALILYLIFSVPAERRWRWALPVGGGIALALCLTALYNWLRFGSFLATGYHEVAWDSPPWFGLFGLLLSPGKGVFFYAPVLILGLGAWRLFARRNPYEGWLIAGLWVSFLVFFAPYKFWTGGSNWGPRFLLPLVPLSVLPVGAFLEERRSQAAWALFAFLCLSGFFLQIPAILVDHSRGIAKYVLESSDPNAYTWTIVDPARSPLRTQWIEAIEVMSIYRQARGWQAAADGLATLQGREESREVPNGTALLEAEFYRLNTLDFWWLRPKPADLSAPAAGQILPWFILAAAGLWGMQQVDRRTRKEIP